MTPTRSRGRAPMMNASEPLMRHLERITCRKGLIRQGRREVAPFICEARKDEYWSDRRRAAYPKPLSSAWPERPRQGVEMASKGACYQATTVNLGTPSIGLLRLGRSTDVVDGGRRVRSSRWASRPTHGGWESQPQGEGTQLHRLRGQATLAVVSRE